MSNDISNHVASQIKLLICDVDGVLTNGSLTYTSEGEESKTFNVKDGLGIRVLEYLGIPTAIITARDSDPLYRRVSDLGIQHFYPGQDNKIKALNELSLSLGIPFEKMAYIGDDVLDLPVMRQVGLSITVADAHEMVIQESTWITKRSGGQGAVREAIDSIIKSRMDLADAYNSFLEEKLGKDILTTA